MSELTGIMNSSGNDEMMRQQLFHLPNQAAQKPEASSQLTAEAVRSVEDVEEEDSSPLSEEETKALQEAIQQLDQLVKPLSIGLSVQRIETINRLYVQLLDRQTGETLREIPPRKILEMQENIRAFQGLLFDKFS